jgi:glycosyltransferase involved in cell wall biosynthesis
VQGKQTTLLAITNLYPVPWAPYRASFNHQQFTLLSQHIAVRTLVLVPWREWLRHRNACQQTTILSYVPYFQLPGFGHWLTPWFQRWAIASKQRWINQAPPTHILASWAFPDAVACLMYAKDKEISVLVKAHGTDVNEHTRYPRRQNLMAHWLNQAKVVFCASQALAHKLIDIGIANNKVFTNYNGVDTSLFYPEPTLTQKKCLLFVGNLIETKGVFELLTAFKSQENHTDLTLHYIGQGPAAAALKQKIQQAGLADSVFLHGSMALPAVAEHIRQATLLVLPSHREGVPNVLLEAFASGVPVVATNVGGIPEVVNKTNGILVEPHNSSALAAAISAALSQQWQKDTIVADAARYNWQHNVQHLLTRL